MDKDLVVDREDREAKGKAEMYDIQSQRRVVLPPLFMDYHDLDIGGKVIVKCTEDGILIKNASEVV